MGLKDTAAEAWSGKAASPAPRSSIAKATASATSDKLVEPDGWEASVAPADPRAAKDMPGRRRHLERIATVGVVLHLADVQADASLTVTVKDQETTASRCR